MYIVDGFVFEDEAMAELAKKEEEGIRFIKERTAFDNAEMVLKLYKKLLEQELFVTPVGVRFLTELQNILLSSVYIAKDEIPPICVKEQKPVQKVEGPKQNYKKTFHIALFFAIVFGLSIIGMFVITELSGNNVNIINYREELLNEYSIWESELEEKEAELKAWEAELEKRSQ